MLAATILFKCCSEPWQHFERLNSTLNVGCPNVKSTKILLAAACNMKSLRTDNEPTHTAPGVRAWKITQARAQQSSTFTLQLIQQLVVISGKLLLLLHLCLRCVTWCNDKFKALTQPWLQQSDNKTPVEITSHEDASWCLGFFCWEDTQTLLGGRFSLLVFFRPSVGLFYTEKWRQETRAAFGLQALPRHSLLFIYTHVPLVTNKTSRSSSHVSPTWLSVNLHQSPQLQ